MTGEPPPQPTVAPATGPTGPAGRVLIELAGPAGAGKTSLARWLQGEDPAAALSRRDVVRSLVRELPVLSAARLSAGGRTWTREELRSLGYLLAWRAHAGAWAGMRDGPALCPRLGVFDHGPVFRLTSLAAFGPPMVSSRAFSRRWAQLAEDWGRLLDVIVWLDAPDDVLVGRIDRRARDHRVRGASATQASSFLARYRAAYRTSLEAVTRGGARLVELDATAPPGALVAAVRTSVDPGRCR